MEKLNRPHNSGAIGGKTGESALEEKSSFKMLELSFSSKFDCGFYIISVAKTTSKKIGAFIRSMKFPSLEVAPYVYKCTIRPCVEYCCHLCAVVTWV